MSNTIDNEKNVYYGVYRGRISGVFTSKDCLESATFNFNNGSVYEEFDNYGDALKFAASGKVPFSSTISPNQQMTKNEEQEKQKKVADGLSSLSVKIETTEEARKQNKLDFGDFDNASDFEKLSKELAIWKEKKKEFKDTTFKTALYAKTLFESKKVITEDSIKSKGMVTSLRNLLDGLLELVEAATTMMNKK